MGTHGILIPIDESEAAERAVRYVGELVDGRPGVRVRLLHLLPPVPPGHLEHGGAEDPAVEHELDQRLRESRARWIAQAEHEAEPVLDRARRLLAEHGVRPETVEAECRASVDEVAVARECIEAARAAGCDTIAVGRGMLPWYREMFHQHPCEELVKRADELAVWVIR